MSQPPVTIKYATDNTLYEGEPIPQGVVKVIILSDTMSLRGQWAPNESKGSSFARPIEMIDRPGRRAIAAFKGKAVPEFSFTLLWGYEDGKTSVEPALDNLMALADSGETVTVMIGNVLMVAPYQVTAWVITDVSISVKRRNANGAAVHAETDIRFRSATKLDIEASKMLTSVDRTITPPAAVAAATANQQGYVDTSTLAGIERASGPVTVAAMDKAGIRNPTRTPTPEQAAAYLNAIATAKKWFGTTKKTNTLPIPGVMPSWP